MALLLSQIKEQLSKDKVKNYFLALIVLAIIAVIVFVFIFIMHYRVKALFSIREYYDAADLTSSIVMAIATVIYVIFTAFIFYTTNENTKQSMKNTEQNAKAQKIAYLERRLELFYLPMKNFLTLYKPEIYKNEVQKCIDEAKDDVEITRFIKMKNEKFVEDYQRLIPFSYLATDETMNLLHEAVHIFNDTRDIIGFNLHIKTKIGYYQDEENINKYDNIKLEINKRIESLKDDLAELVN